MDNQLPHEQLRELEAMLQVLLADWVRAGRVGLYKGNRSRMAKDTGVSRETIWKIERLLTKADADTVRALADKLGPPPVLRVAQREGPVNAPRMPHTGRLVREDTKTPPNQNVLPDVAFRTPVVVWDTAEEDEIVLSLKDWKKVGEAVAKKWHLLIVERKLPFNDLLDLLQAEENWLRHKKHHAAASDIAKLLANLHDFLDSPTIPKHPSQPEKSAS